MVYERARKWLEEKHIETKGDAENFLIQHGEDIHSRVWEEVLDAIYPNAEIASISPEFALGQQQQQELQQKPQDLSFIDRTGRFIRRLLRGQI